ncbi:MAG TPA: hypothetical protein VE911_10400 [Candidatus Nitrosopolaris sp.]|nr:hypothetical protein [Candidatus Nitrosopolaris sp.]
MSPAHRRFLVLEQGVGAAIFNFVLNAGIAWLLFHQLDTVPIRGQQSIVGDTVATSVILPFLTCLIVTPIVRRRIRQGALAPLDARAPLAWLPRRTGLRALVFGCLGGLAFAPVTIAILDALGVTALGFRHFVVFKASFAALAALVVTPVISLAALAGDVAPAVTGAGQRAAQGG